MKIPRFPIRRTPKKLGPHPSVLKALLQSVPPPPVSTMSFQPPLYDQPSNIPTLGVDEYRCVRATEREGAPDPAAGTDPAEVVAAIAAAPKPQE